MKVRSVIIGLLLASLGAYIVYNSSKPDSRATDSTSTQVDPFEELVITGDDLSEYYSAYENPLVIAIRTSLNNYLIGKTIGLTDVAIEAYADENATVGGLDSFSKDYYRSKFIVLDHNRDADNGGEVVSIIFQDKPDKQFNIWMYVRPDGIEMRSIYQNSTFNEATLTKQERQFLSDKVHA